MPSASTGAGLLVFPLSSASVRIWSSLDSTPATACCRNEPHIEDCFAADMITILVLRLQKAPVAWMEIVLSYTSQLTAHEIRQGRVLEKLPAGFPLAAQTSRINII